MGQVFELHGQLDHMQAHSSRLVVGGFGGSALSSAELAGRPSVGASASPISPAPSGVASSVGAAQLEHAIHLQLRDPSDSPARDIATLLK